MRYLLIGVLAVLSVACAGNRGPLLWPHRAIDMHDFIWVGFKMPPEEWAPTGRYAGCTVIDGWYLEVDDESYLGKQEHVARVECPQTARRSQRVAIIAITTQRLVAHGAFWIGDPRVKP